MVKADADAHTLSGSFMRMLNAHGRNIGVRARLGTRARARHPVSAHPTFVVCAAEAPAVRLANALAGALVQK